MLKVSRWEEAPFAGVHHGRRETMTAVQQLRLGFFTEIYRPVVNGVVASIEGLADGLRSRGHQVYCFAPRMPGYIEPDGPVFRMPSLPLPTRTPYRLTLPLVSRRNLNRVIKHLSLVHVHSPFVTGWMGLRYARRFGMPLVYTYHTQLEEYAHYVPFARNPTRFAASQLTRAFANAADAVVVPTAAMAVRLRQLGVSVRIEVVPSGIDLNFFGSGRRDGALRSQLGIGPEDRMLLYVGRLAKEKNVELLLAALALVSDAALKLVIAGEGPHREPLEQFARAKGVAASTVFMGAVARERLPDLYASADAFLMPSTTETQGLVIAEALAAGAYVIASDAPQNRDVLEDAGFITEPIAERYGDALRSLPPQPYSGAAQARKAAQRFSLAQQVERMEALYGSLIRPTGSLDHEHMFALQ